MIHSQIEAQASSDPHHFGKKESDVKIWNFSEVVEPVNRGECPGVDVLTPSAKQRYVVLIAVMVIGALLLGPSVQMQTAIGALAAGWALGQFLRWEPPR